MATTLRADRVGHDIAAGYIKIDQPVPGYYNNANTTAALLVGVNGLTVVTNVVNMGDYRVQIGDSQQDDTNNGVIIVSVAQNGRANWTNDVGVLTNNFQTPCAIPYGGGYWEAGIFRCPPISSTTANQGEDNVDVAVAYFPFSSWRGGYALNGANGLELTNFVGSSGLVLGTHFRDYLTNSAVSDAVANGVCYLDLRSFGIDSRRDGVLLVNGAKNEANYALSRVNDDDDEMDGTWTIYSHDNRANGRTYEQDPLAFVFVPKTDTSVVSGMFMGDGTIAIHSGATPQFAVTWRTDLGNGNYELKIPGRSPADGILIVSAAGGDPNNGDNIVTFQPNAVGDGWIIQSRDLPGCGLQSLPENEAVCSFVFVPAEKPGITVTPSKNLLTTEAGGTAQFTVTVNGYPMPTGDVTIALSSSDTSEGVISPANLTFTPVDWNVPQTVTLTGVDDGVVDGAQPYSINLSATTSTDANYDGLTSGKVGAINIDNEAGVSLDASTITTTEAGGTATFSIWLNTAPTGDVTLTLSSSDTGEAAVSPASLKFTPSDYGAPQTVTVTGVDDFVQDGPAAYFVVTAAATSADPAYNNFDALDVAGQNLDNDSAGVIVPASKLTVTEPSGTASFAVVLASEPVAAVTVNCVSADTTEGTVTPSVVFTPANWNVPQTVTVTAVDDSVNDGATEFSIVTSVTSTDPLYATFNPDDVVVTTLDNEVAFVLPSGDFTYGIGEAAKGIDGYATLNDPDTVDYSGGGLTVTIAAGASGSDLLDVRNTGTDIGQIGVAGGSITYQGAIIGTKAGGTGGAPLTITFTTAAATPEAAQALVRSVTYQNTNANLSPQTQTLSFAVADGDGGLSTAMKTIIIRLMRVDSYQQNGDGGFGLYTGAMDTQIHHQFPQTAYPAGYSASGLWLDYDTASLLPEDQMQCFLKFTNLFGASPGQIPAGAKIVFAELIMNVTDSGHGARFNRMLVDWDEGVTFESLGSGIALDDTEAVSGTNAFLGDQSQNTTTGSGFMKIGVTSDIQAWADGTNNFGWVMNTWPNGVNGTAFSPCEATNVVLRPRLRIGWLPPQSASAATFCQGVNGYSGTVDTQVRLVGPDTTYAAATTLSPDPLVASAPVPNPQQVLIRFDNIIGVAADQVPARATIHAAILDLTSIQADSQGAGGLFHTLLKPWDASNTWNTWVNGISADGVEAALSPTATLPSEGYGATVQATRHAVEITADVQAWVNSVRENNGWVILPWEDGSNGWNFNSAEASLADMRPQLRVYYTPAVATEVVTLLTPVVSPTTVLVSFTGSANKAYTVQRVGVLGATWETRGTATTGADGKATFTDATPLAGAAFYRVISP